MENGTKQWRIYSEHSIIRLNIVRVRERVEISLTRTIVLVPFEGISNYLRFSITQILKVNQIVRVMGTIKLIDFLKLYYWKTKMKFNSRVLQDLTRNRANWTKRLLEVIPIKSPMKFDIILPHPEQLSSNLGYGGEGGGRHSIHKESHTQHLRPRHPFQSLCGITSRNQLISLEM